jgi:two-component system sensor histidine kinase KdpD
VLGLASVGIATAVLVALGADLTFAALTLLFVVVAASLLGYPAGVASAVLAAMLLNYSFTPPLHSFSIEKTDDVLALAAFVAISLIVGSAVARLNELRRRSELGAREARVRLEATNALLSGQDPSAVLQSVTDELVALFDLAWCEVVAGGASARATGEGEGSATVVLRTPSAVLRAAVDRPLRADERDTLEALLAGLGTALDRSRLQQEAREQQLRADLDRSRIGFLSAVTHEVRTPIATIRTATGALRSPSSSLDDQERAELVDAAYEESTRLERLVTKVLDLTRIRAGAVTPEVEPVSVDDLVRAAVSALGPAAAAREITLDVDPDLDALSVDPLLLEHVLANLLENAVAYDTTGGAIEVHARARRRRVEIAVVDHGPGIAPLDRDRVFDEFVRLPGPPAAGSGLGLTIVRALTEANGGHVRLDATPGGGATFVLDLPADHGEEAGV